MGSAVGFGLYCPSLFLHLLDVMGAEDPFEPPRLTKQGVKGVVNIPLLLFPFICSLPPLFMRHGLGKRCVHGRGETEGGREGGREGGGREVCGFESERS